MSENTTKRIPIERDYFCDGHCQMLISSSFGGSHLKPYELSDILFNDREKAKDLIKEGICFPVCFDGDCALDGVTVFVLGDLTEEEERDWIARIRWKLKVPCGKLALVCGFSEEELERIHELRPPEENYNVYQIIDVPPDEYLVELYAYRSSMTVQVSLLEEDEEGYLQTNEELADWYKENHPGVKDVQYIIRLTPLNGAELEMPNIDEGWFEEFEYRKSKV